MNRNTMDKQSLVTLIHPLPVNERVTALRKLWGMSQQAAADQVGVHRETWASWEAGPDSGRHHAPGEDSRAALGVMFGLPAYVFSSDYGPENARQMYGPAGKTLPPLDLMVPQAPAAPVSEREEATTTPGEQEQSNDQAAEVVASPPPTGVTRIFG